MAYATQAIDRAGDAEMVRMLMERTLADVDALVSRKAHDSDRSDQLQQLLSHYEQLNWHALSLGA